MCDLDVLCVNGEGLAARLASTRLHPLYKRTYPTLAILQLYKRLVRFLRCGILSSCLTLGYSDPFKRGVSVPRVVYSLKRNYPVIKVGKVCEIRWDY